MSLTLHPFSVILCTRPDGDWKKCEIVGVLEPRQGHLTATERADLLRDVLRNDVTLLFKEKRDTMIQLVEERRLRLSVDTWNGIRYQPDSETTIKDRIAEIRGALTNFSSPNTSSFEEGFAALKALDKQPGKSTDQLINAFIFAEIDQLQALKAYYIQLGNEAIEALDKKLLSIHSMNKLKQLFGKIQSIPQSVIFFSTYNDYDMPSADYQAFAKGVAGRSISLLQI